MVNTVGIVQRVLRDHPQQIEIGNVVTAVSVDFLLDDVEEKRHVSVIAHQLIDDLRHDRQLSWRWTRRRDPAKESAAMCFVCHARGGDALICINFRSPASIEVGRLPHGAMTARSMHGHAGRAATGGSARRKHGDLP